MCMLFIFVDMGPAIARVLNVLLYPTPHSMMFWDMVLARRLPRPERNHCPGDAAPEREGVKPPHWIKPVIILSIP